MKRIALAAAVTLAAGFLLDPFLESFPPLCIFRMVTGLPCIFCGMTHAVVYAVHGQWSLASQSNPAWWLILPLFVAAVARPRRVGWAVVALAVMGTVVRASLVFWG